MVFMRRAGLLVVALFALPGVALAQHPHEPGDPGIAIVHDVPDDGRTFVGNTVQFGYIVLDEGKPTVHKDGKLTIIHNGRVVYETHTTASGHDYDGLNMAMVTFTTPGPYEIQAEVPGSGGTRTASFSGYVHPLADDAADARLSVDVAQGMGSCGSFTIGVEDESGRILNHTDAIVEIRRADDDRLLFRTHLHTHSDPMEFTYDFERSGQYIVRVIGHQAFPSKSAAQFASLVQTVAVDIGPDGETSVPCAALREAPASPETGRVAGGAQYELHATYDPGTTVYPFGNIRLNGVVLDATTRLPVAHVDFTATLRQSGQTSPIFTSQALHEYDGIYELLYAPSERGDYELELTAMRGDWSQTQTLEFTVLPVGLPLAVGPGIVDVSGLDTPTAWSKASVEFATRTVAGTPIMHSEVDFQIRSGDRDGPVVLQNKLHTHGDGRMGFDVALTEPGRYVLVLDPTTLNGEPVTSFDINALGRGLAMPFEVAPGSAPAIAPYAGEGAIGDADVPEVPTVGGAVALLVLAVVAAVARRRA